MSGFGKTAAVLIGTLSAAEETGSKVVYARRTKRQVHRVVEEISRLQKKHPFAARRLLDAFEVRLLPSSGARPRGQSSKSRSGGTAGSTSATLSPPISSTYRWLRGFREGNEDGAALGPDSRRTGPGIGINPRLPVRSGEARGGPGRGGRHVKSPGKRGLVFLFDDRFSSGAVRDLMPSWLRKDLVARDFTPENPGPFTREFWGSQG